VRILGFPGFMPTGQVEFLSEKFGLTAGGVERAAREAIAIRPAQ
jgi:transketolase